MKRAFISWIVIVCVVAGQTASAEPPSAGATSRPFDPSSRAFIAAEPTDPSEPPPLVDPDMTSSPPRNEERFDPIPPKDTDKHVPIPGLVLIGIGSVGIAIGIAGIVVAGHKGTIATNDAKAIVKGGGLCQPIVGNYASKCREVADAASAHNTWQKVGRGGLAVGIAAAVAGIVYVLWPDARPKPKRNIESSLLSPTVIPYGTATEGGLQLSGVLR